VRSVSRIVPLALALVVTVGCETDVPTAAEREAIELVMRPFLTQLAAAYTERDPAKLEGLAAPRLIAEVERGFEALAAGGRRLEPVLKSYEITDLKVLRHANAIVALTEVWDTRSFDASTGDLIGRDENSVLHSHVQLKRVEDRWLVLFREVEETATGPRLVLPTKAPSPG